MPCRQFSAARKTELHTNYNADQKYSMIIFVNQIYKGHHCDHSGANFYLYQFRVSRPKYKK